jgi:large subunit ribosomal protein L24e
MLTVDPSFEFEKRRNEPVKYNRELWQKTIESMKKITEIRERRENHFVMQRLRKATELELHQDIRDVQKNLTLIRSPAAGLKERRAKEEAQAAAMMEEDDEENITYVDARELERKLEESGGMESDSEMLAEV